MLFIVGFELLYIENLFHHGAEAFSGWSAYNYTLNSPVNYTHPDGKIPWPSVFGNGMNAWVSSGFGMRMHPIFKTEKIDKDSFDRLIPNSSVATKK